VIIRITSSCSSAATACSGRDRIEFVGQRARGINTRFHDYSDRNVYWLDLDATVNEGDYDDRVFRPAAGLERERTGGYWYADRNRENHWQTGRPNLTDDIERGSP